MSALTIYPTRDGLVYRQGSWTPEAVITGARDKRFTDAELAAEYWASHGEANAYMTGNPRIGFSRRALMRRMASLPHFDEATS